jgi:hypothetical protein
MSTKDPVNVPSMPDDEANAAYLELLTDIHTFEELETILLLTRNRDQGMTLPQLATDAGLPADVVQVAVARLCAEGLVVSAEGAYRLDWADSRRSAGFVHLLSEYDRNRFAVLSQLSSNALRRVRTAALRAFSKAFLLRRRDDG